jgi:hypothetical protein
MRMTERDKRDWSLLIFIVPLGILLMLIAGQIAIQVMPQWRLPAWIGSNLSPDSSGSGPRPVYNQQILTPFSWIGDYLTPMSGEIVPIPFIILEPSATPPPTIVTPTPESPSPTVEPTETATPSPTAPQPTLPPPTIPPSEDPPDPPPPTPIPTEPPTPPPPGNPSELDDSLVFVPPPGPINLDAPDDNAANLANGSYTVLTLSSPIVVLVTPDEFYDLIFYEYNEEGTIYMDHIIIGISQHADGSIYYEVFNWGNNVPDTNTNVDITDLPPQTCRMSSVDSSPECDDREFSPDDLYPYPGTGVLIDVDTAQSEPPPGEYEYIVIISPVSGIGDPSQIDAIVVTKVPIPPTPDP